MDKIMIEDIKNDYDKVDEIVFNDYVPIYSKDSIIKNIVDSLFLENRLHYDVLEKEILTVIASVGLYTNVDIEYNDFNSIYDTVKKSGLYNKICLIDDWADFLNLLNESIKKRELELSFSNSLNDSIIRITKSIENMLDKINIDELAKSFSEFSNVLANKIPDIKNFNEKDWENIRNVFLKERVSK